MCGYGLLLLKDLRRRYRASESPTTLRSGWNDTDAVESLGVIFVLMDLVLAEILSKTSFVVYSTKKRI